ncbi:MAG: hypothetical protein AAB975_04355 [Patescibacteria group bacterium]
MNKELHKHICENCIRPWEHDDTGCARNKVAKCDICVAVTRAQLDHGAAFAEMARNMPIPHDHKCLVCRRMWEHNDKACALKEIYQLECEECMTFTITHPCPKCGTASEEQRYAAYSVIRCVCPKCRHYFVPQGSKDEVYKAQEKEGAESNSECEYLLRSHNPNHAKEGDADICPKCGTQVTADVCIECGYHILLDSTDGYEGVG